MTRAVRRRAWARVLMVQGTASCAGKSTLVAALCRVFARRGLRVAPFKAQNISLNAAVTPDGGEMSVAQAVQARAAGIAPTVEMNPVLVKPEAGGRAQIVLLGRVAGIWRFGGPDGGSGGGGAGAGPAGSPDRTVLWRAITRSLDALRSRCDLVVIEGAGSPAEINLRRWDLANMRVARYARAPVLLVGDIDRGGVFAALLGTMALLAADERRLVRGFVINKFRGDPAGLRSGITELEARTRRPVLGVLPYAPEHRLPEEDAGALDARTGDGPSGRGVPLDVVVVHLPYISNFDEFDALEREPGVRVRYVRSAGLLGRPDLIVLPGSKATVADLECLRRSGMAEAIPRAAAAGIPVLGICGGYQMLGERLLDPHGVESTTSATEGLGLLRAVTTFAPEKRTAQVRARVVAPVWAGAAVASGPLEVDGYEIHLGRTIAEGPPFLWIDRRGGAPAGEPDGSVSDGGLVWGTSVHGLLRSATFRLALLDMLLARRAGRAPDPDAARASRTAAPALDQVLDGLADLAARHLDLDRLRAIISLA